MPAEVLEVTTRFMREPIRILVKKEELTLEGIRQVCPNSRFQTTKTIDISRYKLNSLKWNLTK